MKRLSLVRRCILQGLALLALGLAVLQSARAEGIELLSLELQRQDGALNLEFGARLNLSRTVEDALQRGVPVYFVAQATLYRNRWYWRDERMARVNRSWRVAFQPLTATWRVGTGGLSQSYASLGEVLASISRSRWKLADLAQIDGEGRHYVEFSYRLDNSQLPPPLQLGLGGQADWALGVERTLRID